MKPRELFTDGWNSFVHIFLGIISVRFHIIIPFFLLYQLIHYNDMNLFIDISEFFIGFIISRILLYVFHNKKMV